MLKDEYKVYEEKMRKSIDSVAADFAAVRAGRANAAVLDRISVDYYGAPTPIQQIAAIGSPDAAHAAHSARGTRAPLKPIEKAIQNSDLGINPQNDGKAIRLTFPQLTEERRKELVKQVRKYAEDGKVAIRNIRRDAMETFKKKQKASELTEDDLKIAEKDLQKLTDDMCKELRRPAREEGKGTDGGLMGLFTKRQLTGQVDKNSLPRHVAVIMDGNGRWAQKRGLAALGGPQGGRGELPPSSVPTARSIGIDYLTVYAFSTENWKRPPEEIDGIMQPSAPLPP